MYNAIWGMCGMQRVVWHVLCDARGVRWCERRVLCCMMYVVWYALLRVPVYDSLCVLYVVYYVL